VVDFFTFPLSLVLFISCLAELNHTSIDFAGGECELVTGLVAIGRRTSRQININVKNK
jgi:hypothetical protein